MEQVQKTCQTLQALGFSEITMFETLLRTHEPVSIPMPTVANAVTRIKEVEKKKELRRDRQIAEAKKRREGVTANEDEQQSTEELEIASTQPSNNKRSRTDDSPDTSVLDTSTALNGQHELIKDGTNSNKPAIKPGTSTAFLETCKPALMSRGHTSFLTFAILLPKSSTEVVAEPEIKIEDGLEVAV